MKTIITSIVGVIVVWLRAAKIIDIDPEAETAIMTTIGIFIAIFMRLGILKAEKAADEAGQKAEAAVGHAADMAAVKAMRAMR